MSELAEVSAMAIQAESAPTQWEWVDRTIWTERMLAALGNGVKGNKWFSLIDKVHRPATLKAAWLKVKANKGAEGVDGQSIVKFAAKEETYLGELETARILLLIESFLKQDIMKGLERWTPTGALRKGASSAP